MNTDDFVRIVDLSLGDMVDVGISHSSYPDEFKHKICDVLTGGKIIAYTNKLSGIYLGVGYNKTPQVEEFIRKYNVDEYHNFYNQVSTYIASFRRHDDTFLTEDAESFDYVFRVMGNKLVRRSNAVKVNEAATIEALDISNWRAWANNKPGECGCGIKIEMCDYHK